MTATMNFYLPHWLAHHALKLSACLTIAPMAAFGLDLHLALKIAAVVLFVIGGVIGALGFLHSRQLCPRCKPHPGPARWHHRAWAAFGRNGGLPAFAFVVLSLVSQPVLYGEGRSLTWAIHSASMPALVLLYLSAMRFNNVNNPARPARTPGAVFFQGRGKGLPHHADRLALALFALLSVCAFLPTGNDLLSSLRILLVVLVYFAHDANHRHSLSMCEQCFQDFRVDAPDYARARAWRFTVVHRFGPVSLLVIVAGGAGAYFLDGVPSACVIVAMYALLAIMTLLDRFHAAYRPWCPQCGDDGGGGSDECAHQPDPTGGHGRPVPVS